MAMFVMIGRDRPDGAERRNRYRAEHVAYLDALHRAGRIAYAGPIRSDADDRSVGAVIVLDAESLEDARSLVDKDPYVVGGVYETWTLERFRQVFPKDEQEGARR